ncbi:MAG: hypothetical protein OXF02_00780 [Simkaniaceae bacterium]|nr:hypothetical protein [Simkaniaceae bacterium]
MSATEWRPARVGFCVFVVIGCFSLKEQPHRQRDLRRRTIAVEDPLQESGRKEGSDHRFGESAPCMITNFFSLICL